MLRSALATVSHCVICAWQGIYGCILLSSQIWSKWGIPRTGYLVPGHLGPGSARCPEMLGNRPLGGCRPPRPPPLSRPIGLQNSGWFDWVTARMAVQFTGLIEWLPGWLSSLMVWLSDSQDGCPVYWFDRVTARMAGSQNGLSFSKSEHENISFQGSSYKGPFQKLTSTK